MTPLPLPSVPRDDMASMIAAAWNQRLFTQEQAAADLGFTQGQVSKLVNGEFKRPTGRAWQLYEYSKRLLGAQSLAGVDVESMRAALTARLMRAWDETAEGANALEAILEGASRLRLHRSR